MISFNEYQNRAHETAHVYEQGCDVALGNMLSEGNPKLMHLLYVTLGLVGEAGEFAGKVKKIIRDKGGLLDQETLSALLAEAGDCYWYLAEIGSVLGVLSDQIAVGNLAKLKARREAGTIHGSGDDR